MNFLKSTFIIFCSIIIHTRANNDQLLERINKLEENQMTLQEKVNKQKTTIVTLKSQIQDQYNFEVLLVKRYGLVRRCDFPVATHADVVCNSDEIIPGTYCRAVCHTGFIGTPHHEDTHCQQGGIWSRSLQCELPLVVVSGGAVNSNEDGTSSVEILNFHQSSGCNILIPDTPTYDGEARKFHNMFYERTESKLIICNGLRLKPVTNCDSWQVGDAEWKNHSWPHKAVTFLEKVDYIYNSRKAEFVNLSEMGRYASASGTLFERTVMVGGMVNSANEENVAIDSGRQLVVKDERNRTFWEPLVSSLKSKKAFLCGVTVRDAAFVVIGGYTNKSDDVTEVLLPHNRYHYKFRYLQDKKSVEEVEKKALQSLEKKVLHGLKNAKQNKLLSNLNEARSGHGCSGFSVSVNSSQDYDANILKIIVSGGSQTNDAEALVSTEVYHWSNNSWTTMGNMIKPRFGHHIVTVGHRIIAIGGKERNPDIVLDSMEEYDPVSGTWTLLSDRLSVPRTNFGATLIPHSIIPGCIVQES